MVPVESETVWMQAEVKDFSRLYSRKAHVHHYTNFMEREEFDHAFETVNSLIKDYIHLDMLWLGCFQSCADVLKE